MKFTIAQIGENRLKKVLVNDKQNNPQKLCEVLKSDFLSIAKCYLDNPQVDIDAKQVDEKVVFDIAIKADRVKSLGVLSS